MKKYILAIDQGTTGSTAALVDEKGRWVESASNDFPQIFPKPGWVEHNPEDIWQSVIDSITQVLAKSKIDAQSISAIGITNQRETIVAWDSETGRPIYNAIVWQCRRTAGHCEQLRKKGLSKKVKALSGLVLDPYFSATKISWILENVSEAKELLRQKKLKVGTIDSFLLWRLTAGQSHKTEVSNASRIMLMNLKKLDWDLELLRLFKIPLHILPAICGSSDVFGVTKGLGFLPDGIQISGILGDQQAALFGQACFKPGTLKCTFGTGSFILMNTGPKILFSKHGMLTTVAWKIGSKVTYAIEGGAFVCGAAVQWLRDGLGIINSAKEIETLASQVESSDGVEFVPALTGLGAPYWDPDARGLISGLTRGTSKSHIARATLDAMALQNVELIQSMEKDLGKKIKAINVDGGATENDLLMQLQSNYSGKEVIRPQITETTAYGAALVAGLGIGLWKNSEELINLWTSDRKFKCESTGKDRRERMVAWKAAIKKTLV